MTNREEEASKVQVKGHIIFVQYFSHLMGRTDSLEKTLMLGKIEGRRRRGRQRMRWLDGITDSMDMSLGELRVLFSSAGLCAVTHKVAVQLPF